MMRRGILFVIVALVSGCTVYFCVPAPLRTPVSHSGVRYSPGSPPTTGSASAQTPSSISSIQDAPPSISSSRPLDVPLPAEQRASADLEAQRSPFYVDLRRVTGPQFSRIEPSATDPTTLEMRATIGDEQITTTLGMTLRAVNAQYYGFKRAVLYFPNPPDDFQPFRIEAEGTVDSRGIWTLYRK